MVAISKNNCLNCDCEINVENKFCSSSCSAIYNNKHKVKKKYGFCLNCNSELKRKGQKYCSNKCQGVYTNKKNFQEIENGNLNYHEETFKRYLIHKYGAKCMECGWDKINPYTKKVPIQIEHKDGNSENNDLKNLKLLCPNCHSLTSTYGALNKGNGRKKRQEKRKKNKMAQ